MEFSQSCQHIFLTGSYKIYLNNPNNRIYLFKRRRANIVQDWIAPGSLNSSQMNAIVDQLIPPNSANFARKFVFSANGTRKEALVVVKTNILEVYQFNEKLSRLILLSKSTLATRVESIQVLSRPAHDDLVFVSFADCKVKFKNSLITLLFRCHL